MLFSFVILFWLVIAVLLLLNVSPLPCVKWRWQVTAMWLSCVCCVGCVANAHQLSPSVLHWLEWLPISSLPSLAAHIHADILLCPQPDTDWQQPAIRGGTWAADLHFKEAEQRCPAGRHGQHRYCGTKVTILHIPSQLFASVVIHKYKEGNTIKASWQNSTISCSFFLDWCSTCFNIIL